MLAGHTNPTILLFIIANIVLVVTTRCLQVLADEPLMAAGLDSLGTVELRNTLETTLDISLPPTLAMDYPTAGAIAGYIAAKLPQVAVESADESSELADDVVTNFTPAAVTHGLTAAMAVTSMTYR